LKERKALDFLWMYKARMNTKIKALKPSLRESNRYIAFEIISDSEIKDFDKVRDSIELESRNLLGDLTLAKAGFMLIKNTWNPSSQRGILKVEKKYADHAKAVLTLVKEIDNQKVTVRSLLTSGMINRVKKLTIGG
jgi:ribonuclease P/MRP protein subunit POP5